jgi:uncharacterized protein YciI
MRFAYIYFMTEDPDRVTAVVAEHVAYWRALRLPEYLGGPFGDRSGGLISFEAGSLDEAEKLVGEDPFVRAKLLSQRWVQHWDVK